VFLKSIHAQIDAHLANFTQSKMRINFGFALFGNISATILGSLGGILAARYLGPAGRGELAAAFSWVAILSTFAYLGLPQAVTYHVARDPASANTILTVVLVFWLGQSVAVVTIGQLIVGIVLGATSSSATGTVWVYMFSVPSLFMIGYLITMAQGLKWFPWKSGLQLVSAAGYPFCVILTYFFRFNNSNTIVAFIVLYQAVIAGIALVWFILRLSNRTWHFEMQKLRDLLRYGIQSVSGDVSWMANNRLDQFMMSFLVPTIELGHYAVAVTYASILFPISGAFSAVLFPEVASRKGAGSKSIIVRTVAANLVLAIPGTVILALVAPIVIPLLFGSDFYLSIYPSAILLIGTVELGCIYIFSDALRGLGLPLMRSLAEMMGLCVTILGLLYALPRYGIIGAAWVSVIAYGCVLALLVYQTGRFFQKQAVQDGTAE
jgi:O-antigen/teichoic acid export membrane protein